MVDVSNMRQQTSSTQKVVNDCGYERPEITSSRILSLVPAFSRLLTHFLFLHSDKHLQACKQFMAGLIKS